MPYKIMKAEKAPPKPKTGPVNKRVAYFREIIGSLKGTDVAAIEPEDGQSQRGIKISIGRVASGMGVKVDSWSVESDSNVYVQLAPMQQKKLEG